MLKKIFLASSLLALTSSAALANPVPYIGGGLGLRVNSSGSYFFNSYRGMPLRAFIGLGGILSQNIYVAGELGVTVATADISNSTLLKTTYGYGASILPGVMLSPHTLAFGRLGVVRSRYTNLDESDTGALFGLGLQTCVTQNVDLRGEYNFTAYRAINRYGFTTAPRTDAFNLDIIYKFD